jgi:uncharacterized protein YbaR (Trm112 family)
MKNNIEQKFNPQLLDILACPVTKQGLIYDELNNELISESAKLAFSIENGIPILIPDKARKL